MAAVASALLAYAGVAALFAGGARRGRVVGLVPPWARPIAHALGVAAFAAALLLWPRADGAAFAAVAVTFAASLAAMLFVLLEPIAPRLVWGAASLAPVAAVVLAALG